MPLELLHPYDGINPPEYRVVDSPECGACRAYVDEDEPRLDMDDDSIRCSDCRESCAACGEWVTDVNPIRMRCRVTGKLEPYCTPDHAAGMLEE